MKAAYILNDNAMDELEMLSLRDKCVKDCYCVDVVKLPNGSTAIKCIVPNRIIKKELDRIFNCKGYIYF